MSTLFLTALVASALAGGAAAPPAPSSLVTIAVRSRPWGHGRMYSYRVTNHTRETLECVRIGWDSEAHESQLLLAPSELAAPHGWRGRAEKDERSDPAWYVEWCAATGEAALQPDASITGLRLGLSQPSPEYERAAFRARARPGGRVYGGRVRASSPSRDRTPPEVTLLRPLDGSIAGGEIDVVAEASDNVGVLDVRLRMGGAPLGPVLTAPPYRWRWNTAGYADGQSVLQVVARDAAGNARLSLPVTVVVDNRPTSPP